MIRLAFIIDAFDREIIASAAVSAAGISGSDVRDMILEAVEKRFSSTRAFTQSSISPTTAALTQRRRQGLRYGAKLGALLHAR